MGVAQAKAAPVADPELCAAARAVVAQLTAGTDTPRAAADEEAPELVADYEEAVSKEQLPPPEVTVRQWLRLARQAATSKRAGVVYNQPVEARREMAALVLY